LHLLLLPSHRPLQAGCLLLQEICALQQLRLPLLEAASAAHQTKVGGVELQHLIIIS
jgi:hypothetical protein